MGDKASSDARSLRAQLAGLNSAEQQKVSYQWALANDKFMDLLGDFANERKLLIFKSGNMQMDEEGYFENDMYILSDIKPKNVLCIDGEMYVIDAEITTK